METRAKYALIGLFTICVVAAAFGFVFWFSGSRAGADRKSVQVIFDTPVTGLSQGASFGDDVQAATNYPIVKIVNTATGHVFYARTSGFTSFSVAPKTKSTTSFTVPGTVEAGASSLYAVANGIQSKPRTVAITNLGGC